MIGKIKLTLNNKFMREQFIINLYNLLSNFKKKQKYNYLKNPINKNYNCGIYFFFDTENKISDTQLKISYIGKTKNNSNNRLEKHQKGNASSFREHVKKALVEKHNVNFSDEMISGYIHNLPFLFIPIKNETHLKDIENHCIQIISNSNQKSIHKPYDKWLGFYIDDELKNSHIWNVQQVTNYNESKNDYESSLNLLMEYINLI